MVLPVSQFLGRRSSGLSSPQNSNRPLLNAIPFASGRSRILAHGGNYRVFWQWFKQTPEIWGTLNIPITDILGDRPQWVDEDGNHLPKEKELEARRWWRDNRGKEVLRSMLFDAFLTGDGFIWKGKASKEERVRAVKEAFAKYGVLELKDSSVLAKAAQDEVLTKTKRIDYVASSTMRILNDTYDILGYEQQVNGYASEFSPEEVIHYRLATLNGEVQGYSPIESLSSEVYMLWLVKGNMLSFMRNGGVPDRLFILPKEIAGSKNHEYLIDRLKHFKSVENRHGQLVFTGEVEIEDLQGNPKDLEYKDLALYVTSTFAFSFGIPVSRIPFLIGKSATGGDSGGLSESGYWNKISETQDTIEDLLNSQLFEEMGWYLKFQRKYKQDEVREAQVFVQQAQTVQTLQTVLAQDEKQLKTSSILNIVGLRQEDVEDLNTSSFMEMGVSGTKGQNLLPDGQVSREPDAQKRASTKRNVANQKGTAEAVTQP